MGRKLFILMCRIIPNIVLRKVLHFEFFSETQESQTPISFDTWYNQKIMGHCMKAHWPVHHTSTVINPRNIYCGIETCPGYSPGNYIQAIGEVYLGDYTQIGPNVGIITANHDPFNNKEHLIKNVTIGRYCWIGMNSVILPGVSLGDFTIVGAGSIVTKSFKAGYAVIAGNPAKVIKNLDPDDCIRHTSKKEYNGYIPNEIFMSRTEKYTNVKNRNR